MNSSSTYILTAEDINDILKIVIIYLADPHDYLSISYFFLYFIFPSEIIFLLPEYLSLEFLLL